MKVTKKNYTVKLVLVNKSQIPKYLKRISLKSALLFYILKLTKH